MINECNNKRVDIDVMFCHKIDYMLIKLKLFKRRFIRQYLNMIV